jgi:hypothetical protein
LTLNEPIIHRNFVPEKLDMHPALQMSKRAPMAALVVVIALFVAACGGGTNDGSGEGATQTPIIDPAIGETGSPTPLPTPFVDVCQANPDPATSAEVQVDSPASEEALVSPVEVRGSITGPEERYRVWLYDPAGRALSGVTREKTPGKPHEFTETIDFFILAPIGACVWVFELGAGDAPLNVTQVPVALTMGE